MMKEKKSIKIGLNVQKLIICVLMLLSTTVAYSQWRLDSFDGRDLDSEKVNLVGITYLDKSKVECIYLHEIYDPYKKAYRDYYKILQQGENYSMYRDYGSFQLDSLVSLHDGELTCGEYNKYYQRYVQGVSESATRKIVKNFAENIVKYYSPVYIDEYMYQEVIPLIDWQLEEVTDTICGYVCQKATTTWRGREWTAWYTEDIPISNGPDKFAGLPGLILRLVDSKREHYISAEIIRKGASEFGPTNLHYIGTTREKYNAALADFMENAYRIIGDSGLVKGTRNASASRKSNRAFFNPIELE